MIPWFPWPWVGRGVKVTACRGCRESYKVRRAPGDNASMSAADGINATAAGSGSGSGGPGWAMV